MCTISLCMIVRDEEAVLGRCLSSVKDIADEIIIIDTGSVDKTKEIAAQYTKKIYDFEWVNDFSKARNFSFSKATMDYILWLDADDIILEKDYKKFINLKKNIDTDIDIYMMEYVCAVDENDNPTLKVNRARLLKREKKYQWVSPIHECIIPSGNIKKEDIRIIHKKQEVKNRNRNLQIFEEMKKNKIELDDRQEYCYAKELYYLQKYDRAIEEYEKYINKYEKVYNEKRHYLYTAIIELANCYANKGQVEKNLETLLKIVKNEVPGPQCCCKIGDVFLNKKNYKAAEFWYKLALNNKDIVEDNIDYNEFIPYICLCVCSFGLGDIKKAKKYNKKAGKLKPNDSTYIYNKKALEEQ